MLDILRILAGLISSVPEAVELWHKIAPLISPNADIHPDQQAAINALVEPAHQAVEIAHNALNTLIGTHAPEFTPPTPPLQALDNAAIS